MKSNATYNSLGSLNNTISHSDFDRLASTVLSISIIPISLFGMATNGIVIWILCFHMKGNSFTTYILNLSIADFALLTALVPDCIFWILNCIHDMNYPDVLCLLLSRLCFFTFSASQFLLAAISVDRCICLFFPLWHKCHRPSYLSTTVCVAIWIITFLIPAIDFALSVSKVNVQLWYYQYLLNTVLCMPVMFMSSIAMVIKIYFISPQHKRGKFIAAILLALVFFLFFGFPVNVTVSFRYNSPFFWYYCQIGSPLNSAINPAIYFLVGRDKKAPSMGRIKKILEKLFQEVESSSEEADSSLKTRLRSHQANLKF